MAKAQFYVLAAEGLQVLCNCPWLVPCNMWILYKVRGVVCRMFYYSLRCFITTTHISTCLIIIKVATNCLMWRYGYIWQCDYVGISFLALGCHCHCKQLVSFSCLGFFISAAKLYECHRIRVLSFFYLYWVEWHYNNLFLSHCNHLVWILL